MAAHLEGMAFEPTSLDRQWGGEPEEVTPVTASVLEELDHRLDEIAEEVDGVKGAINELNNNVQDVRDTLEAKIDHLSMLIRLQVEEKMHETSGLKSKRGS
jgi:hypothetical protein